MFVYCVSLLKANVILVAGCRASLASRAIASRYYQGWRTLVRFGSVRFRIGQFGFGRFWFGRQFIRFRFHPVPVPPSSFGASGRKPSIENKIKQLYISIYNFISCHQFCIIFIIFLYYFHMILICSYYFHTYVYFTTVVYTCV